MKHAPKHSLQALVLVPFLVAGCATDNNKTIAPPSMAASVTTASKEACDVSISQDGKVVSYQTAGRNRTYVLKSRPFQIEVSSARCAPSVGTFNNLDDQLFVASNPYAIGFSGFGMASSPKDDVLVRRSDNPRPAPEIKESFDAYKAEILRLCDSLKRCPNQITGTRNYWNFLLDEAGTQGKVALIRNYSANQPMTKAFGMVPVVVYTKLQPDEAEYRGRGAVLNILETHPMILLFTP
ncbi:hypothetical protein [Rhodoferax aquaticus]|uniref:Uncharacterized protein n=1 Tax=Rhodoferax aquaticus TaxID=2527691 RepID=A0A515EQE7_9BURK|nr:hypothetical protein [Rhodoferax aquaticus]QDL54893.1 hypothetical protein EXZ61_12375 [Rhodoferax aquaticus]